MKRFNSLFAIKGQDLLNCHEDQNTESSHDNQSSVCLEPNGFCLLKPGFVDMYSNEFRTLLEQNGWNFIKVKKVQLDWNQACELYKDKINEPYYNTLCNYMTTGPILCCSCYKETQSPIEDMTNLKETVRAMWGIDDMKNAMHSSDSINNVYREASICMRGAACESIESDAIDDAFNIQKLIIEKLNCAVAEEFYASYFYSIAGTFFQGKMVDKFRNEFIDIAADEYTDHALKLMNRLRQLGYSQFDFNINNIIRLMEKNNHFQVEPLNPNDMRFECLGVALIDRAIKLEKDSIETYNNLLELTSLNDPVTNDLVLEILKDETEHLDKLNELTFNVI